MIEILGYVDELMERKSIPYEYEEWTGNKTSTYFVGQYYENENRLEDGYTSATMMLDGWSRKSKKELVLIADMLKKTCDDIQEIKGKNLFRVRYAGFTPSPVEVEGLHHIIITLEIEEWKGE